MSRPSPTVLVEYIDKKHIAEKFYAEAIWQI